MALRVPLSTYRLQFNSSFRFVDAIPILDYLRDLGVSHVYASPILTSRSGSGHGYDVTDPTKIDSDAGGEEGFGALRSALEERGMGLVIDIVPNHMAASRENRWWMDVLEYGPDSPYASYFDIDWKPPSRSLENKLLLPFLGKPFADVLDHGDLRVCCQEGRLVLQYGDQLFPIAPSSYAEVLGYAKLPVDDVLARDSTAAQEWQGLLAVAQSLAAGNNGGANAAAERRTKFDHMRERLRQLLAVSPEIGTLTEATLREINGTPGDPGSFDKLEHLLAGQHYRLAYWQTPSDLINYRRFFSITDLVGVRVEDPSVFEATHDLAIRMGVKAGCAGFRVDHIDGLRDPHGYLNRLTDRLSSHDSGCGHPYLLVEKILARDEQLPTDWPVQGTTGYDYLNFANRLLVDESQAAALDDIYSRWVGLRADFEDVVYEKKKLVMRLLLAVEMRALGRELGELARDDRYARELHPAELAEALVEITACLPVYRTYIQTLDVPEAAKRLLIAALESARKRRPTLRPEYFSFLSEVLLVTTAPHIRPEQREARLAFVTRWQQFTGSIMAKGLEDTALYVYFPLSSLNEVGGDPRVAAADPLAFHQFIHERRKHWPHSMNATATHDTKRSEDTRARIAVISEIPEKWESCLHNWSRMNGKYRGKVDGVVVPDRNEEYFFYQTLVGIWPLHEGEWRELVLRLQNYLIKAIREANVHSRWSRPNELHEAALTDFVARVLDCRENQEFCSNFAEFQRIPALYGMLSGLGQIVLKVASPGVPDCYQGSELWDLRLVDPDNRGAIDFDARRTGLAGLCAPDSKTRQCVEALLASWCDGRVKLHVLAQALGARKNKPQLFQEGDYRALEIQGDRPDRTIAFARAHEANWAIAVIPRCVASLDAPVISHDERHDFWRDTAIVLPENAPDTWINLLAGKDADTISATSGRLTLGDAFAAFPVALLSPANS